MDREARPIYKKIKEGLDSLRKENSALFKELHKNKHQTLRLLVKIVEEIDPYTKGHSLKVYRYVMKLGKRLGLKGREINIIGKAGLLHDIGKIVVGHRILNKKGELTEEEFSVIKTHTIMGAKIVGEVKQLKESIPHILYHHARYDGGGYPDGKLKSENIPIGARMIAVVDSYHAMISDRPYRKAYSKRHAIEELRRCTGRQYDPRVVNTFIKMQAECRR